MVYERYIKRNGKVLGPYYYESYRDKSGKVKSRYLPNYKPKNFKKSSEKQKPNIVKKKTNFIKIVSVLFLIFLGVFFVFLMFNWGYSFMFQGKTIFGFLSIGEKNIDLTGCGTLDVAGEIYTLNSDIIDDGLTEPCMKILSQNITLNCNGYSIRSMNDQYGVYSNQTNITIKNCIIDMGSGGVGIYLENFNDSLILNNTLINQDIGIYSESLNNVVIQNNNITGNSNHAIYLKNGEDCEIENNSIMFNSGNGIYLRNGKNNSVFNNTVFFNDHGIYLRDSSNNSILENYLDSNSDGIYVRYSSFYNLVENNLINSSVDEGIHLRDDAGNNQVINNTIENCGLGIYINKAGNNMLLNNTLNNNLYNFRINWIKSVDFDNVIDSSNIIDNSFRIYYNYSISDYTYDEVSALDAGIVYCALCNNITIKNLNLSQKNYHGIMIFGTNNSNIINNSVSFNNDGIAMDNAFNNSFVNNTISFNDDDGLNLGSGSKKNSVVNNLIINNTDNGVLIQTPGSDENILIKNNIKFNGGNGIVVETDRNQFISNIIELNGDCNLIEGDGIDLTWGDYNQIINNTINNSCDDGIDLESVAIGNLIENNSVIWNNDEGIKIEDSNYNILTRNFIMNNNDKAIRIANSSYLNVSFNYANSNGDGYIVEDGSTNNNFTGNTALNNSNYGFKIDSLKDSGNVFTNPTSCCNYAVYDIYDRGDSEIINSTCEDTNLLECDNNCSMTCGSGCNYELDSSTTFTQDYFCISNAFKITGDNIVVDCDGHSIKGLRKQNKGFYVKARKNVTIKNCFIYGYEKGIYVKDSENITLFNNSIQENEKGIKLRFSDKNLILNNTLYKNEDGIELETSSENLILGNEVINNTDDGIQVELISNNNIFTMNHVENNMDKGIKFETNSTGNNLTDNIVAENGKDFMIDYDSVRRVDFRNIMFEVRDLHYGDISWNEKINLSMENILNLFNFSFNRVFFNSSAYPELNKSANLTIYNTDSLGFVEKYPLKNGERCYSPDCIVIQNLDTYIFQVRGFSVYSVGGNSGGGSGFSGGGGSGSELSCTPVWVCSDWGECFNGNQTRVCVDYNDCRTNLDKPEEIVSCGEGVNNDTQNDIDVPDSGASLSSFSENTPEINKTNEENSDEKNFPSLEKRGVKKECVSLWNCGEWGDCMSDYTFEDLIKENVYLNGKQIRWCKDVNGCKYDKMETQVCKTKIPIIAKKVQRCSKDYVEIYDLKNVLISRLEFVNGDYKKLNVQMLFDRSAYCPYCFDAVKDFDEDEVDCVYNEGGSCPVCNSETASLSLGYTLLIAILLFLILLCGLLIIWYLKLLKRNAQRMKKIISMGEKRDLVEIRKPVRNKDSGFFSSLFKIPERPENSQKENLTPSMLKKQKIKELKLLSKGIERLKQLEAELNELDTRGFEKEADSIRKKLTDISAIPIVERKLAILKEKLQSVEKKEQKNLIDKYPALKRLLQERYSSFSGKSERLNEIRLELDTLDTSGFEREVESINSKLGDVKNLPLIEEELKLLKYKIYLRDQNI